MLRKLLKHLELGLILSYYAKSAKKYEIWHVQCEEPVEARVT